MRWRKMLFNVLFGAFTLYMILSTYWLIRDHAKPTPLQTGLALVYVVWWVYRQGGFDA